MTTNSNLILILNRYRNKLNNLITQFEKDRNRAAWVFTSDRCHYHSYEARIKLADVLQHLEFSDDRDGRETEICPGIVGASPNTLFLAAEVNQARDDFKAAVIAANRKDPRKARNLLKQNGFPRIHFKQIYRHLPIILKKPTAVRFTWGATRSIKKITRQQAYQKLVIAAGDEPTYGFQQQLAMLETMAKEEPIAIVQDLKPHIKANLSWVRIEDGQKQVTRKMISAPLAILIPLDPGEPLPQCQAAFPEDRKQRKPRADVRIEAEPFLPSIRGHRYLK